MQKISMKPEPQPLLKSFTGDSKGTKWAQDKTELKTA